MSHGNPLSGEGQLPAPSSALARIPWGPFPGLILSQWTERGQWGLRWEASLDSRSRPSGRERSAQGWLPRCYLWAPTPLTEDMDLSR